ncbi:MAG: IMP dehydrogenase, partial [Nanoarchaeota archaeon]
MKKGAEAKSEDEFHGKNYKDRVLIAEGVEGLVPIKGTVKDLSEQALGGIKSGMYYLGTKNIKEQFITKGTVIKFDGFLKVYNDNDGNKEDENEDSDSNILPPLEKN